MSIIIQNSAISLLARVRNADGSYATPADVSGLSCGVWNVYSRTTTGSPTLTVDDCIYSELQTDPRWTTDNIGFNLEVTIPGSYFPVGGVTYQIEILITPTAGATYKLVIDLDCLPTFGT